MFHHDEYWPQEAQNSQTYHLVPYVASLWLRLCRAVRFVVDILGCGRQPTLRKSALMALLLAAAPPARAVVWTQTVAGVHEWTNNANWNGTFPNGSTATAELTNDIAGDQSVVLGAPGTITNQVLRIGNANGNWTLGNGTLRLAGAPSVAQLAGSNTIAADVVLASAATITNANAAAPLTISGNISGGQNIALAGGKFVLSGNNVMGRINTADSASATVAFVGPNASGAGTLKANQWSTAAWRFLCDGSSDNGTIVYGNAFSLAGGQGSGSSATVFAGPQTTASGNKLVFNSLSTGGDGGYTFTVTGTNGYSVEIAGTVNNGGTDKTLAFNPTTANLTLNKIYSDVNFLGKHGNVALNGSAAGNVVRGPITNKNALALTLIKGGTGIWDVQGESSSNINFRVDSGALRLSHAHAVSGGLGTSGGLGNLDVSGGCVELTAMSGDMLRGLGTNWGQVQFTDSGGFSAYGSDRVVNIGGSGAALAWASTSNFIANAKTLIFGSVASDAQLGFQNPINLNGAVRTIQVDDNTNSAADCAVLSGALSGAGSSGLRKTGAGTLILAAVNTYTNATTVSAGTLLVNGMLNGPVAVTNGATLGGTGTISGSVTVYTNGVLRPGAASGAGTLALNSNLTLNAGAIYDAWLDSNGACGRVSVAGTLSLPARATVRVSSATGLSFADMIVLIAYAQSSPAEPDLRGWTVLGAEGRVTATGAQVVLWLPRRATTLTIR
jgi:autotransporter-associated beta strand protein